MERQKQFQQQQLEREERFDYLLKEQVKGNKSLLADVLSKATKSSSSKNISAERFSNSLTEFKYDPDIGSTFPAYFRRFQNLFMKIGKQSPDREKSPVLLQNLGTEEITNCWNLNPSQKTGAHVI